MLKRIFLSIILVVILISMATVTFDVSLTKATVSGGSVSATSALKGWSASPMFMTYGYATDAPTGLSPTQIRAAYNLPSTGGQGTIAIVDAYDDPTVQSDLNVFSSQFGLPPVNSTNFVKYRMGRVLSDSGWALEISLDVEWAHAIAPDAKILLVEAPDTSTSALLAAVNYARTQANVVAVSMSWGGPEFQGQTSYDSYFTSSSGVSFFASSGDNGSSYVSWPASSPNVVGVGGTTLTFAGNGSVASETAWNGSGGGISAYESEPNYQISYGIHDANGRRSVPDVSYDADPDSGVSVYDSTAYSGQTGWWQVGGTSAGAPQWSAIQSLGLTANNKNFYLVASSADYHSYFRDITIGTNGNYSASPGYDRVTGLGSPLTINFAPTIYINANGSITPSTAPISTTDKTTYTFTGNINSSNYGGLVVERSNIVINGEGYMMQGNPLRNGLSMTGIQNVTIKDVTIWGFHSAVYLSSSSNNIISKDNITANEYGIVLNGSSRNNVIAADSITDNQYGLRLLNASNNALTQNKIEDDWEGMALDDSSSNMVSQNNIRGNNQTGLLLSLSVKNSISENNFTANGNYGVWLGDSSNNILSGNNITANDVSGVLLGNSSNYNGVFANNIANNGQGIGINGSSNGISGNEVYFNNFLNNSQQVSINGASKNAWDEGLNSGGNYWSDYLAKYPGAAEIDSSGIWNTPYVINGNNTDHYPLQNMWSPSDVAVVGLTSSRTAIIDGNSVNMTVMLKNKGNLVQTFNLTLYGTPQGSGSPWSVYTFGSLTLTPGSTRTLTTKVDLDVGIYTLSAHAWSLPAEVPTSDNTYTGPIILVAPIARFHAWSYVRPTSI